jgi:uncharacterized protein HemY
MVALGLILIVIAILLFVGGILGGGDGSVTFDLGLFNVDMSPTVVFVLGAVAMLALFLGLGLMRRGARKARERRQERQKVQDLSRQLDAARKDAHEDSDDEPLRDDRPTPI